MHDARGLEVSPGGLLQNELVQRQIGNRLAQPAVLELKVLQALHLLGLQPAELLAPPIIRHLAHPDLADGVHHVLALRDQNIDLPQLGNDLFWFVSLPCHCSQRHTSSQTTSTYSRTAKGAGLTPATGLTYATRPAVPCCLPADDRDSTRRLPPPPDRG